MSKHPIDLLSRTKGMNGYEFKDWLKEITEFELSDLSSMAYSLQDNISEERSRRASKREI